LKKFLKDSLVELMMLLPRKREVYGSKSGGE